VLGKTTAPRDVERDPVTGQRQYHLKASAAATAAKTKASGASRRLVIIES
jgi:hypothetical protein